MKGANYPLLPDHYEGSNVYVYTSINAPVVNKEWISFSLSALAGCLALLPAQKIIIPFKKCPRWHNIFIYEALSTPCIDKK